MVLFEKVQSRGLFLSLSSDSFSCSFLFVSISTFNGTGKDAKGRKAVARNVGETLSLELRPAAGQDQSVMTAWHTHITVRSTPYQVEFSFLKKKKKERN